MAAARAAVERLGTVERSQSELEFGRRWFAEARAALRHEEGELTKRASDAARDDDQEGAAPLERELTATEMTLQMELAAHRETLERAVAERDETIAQLRRDNETLRARLAELAQRAVSALAGDSRRPDEPSQ